ncbi:hypothetical protein ACFLZE_04880 [Thermodesulfobacteriota bacterium]
MMQRKKDDPDCMQALRDKYSAYPDWNLTPGPPGTSETTYSYDIGHIHVVVVNLYWDGADNDAWFIYNPDYPNPPDDVAHPDGGFVPDVLFDWLKNDLRTTTQPYKIVVGHEAAYPYGRHVGDSLDEGEGNRDKFFNLLRTERVFAYVSGHCHYYYLEEHEGIFQVNTGVSGGHVGTTAEDVATLGYAHSDSSGIQFVLAKENPTWATPFTKTVSMADLGTQILVNTAEGAGTLCRYFVDYTGNVEANPDWSLYGTWWENSFNDEEVGWIDGELAVGYDSTNPSGWGWINQSIDEDPENSGDEQVYGVFIRIPFNAYNKSLYSSMKLGIDYDDAITVWLNGTKIYESPTSPSISSADYWDKVASGGHEATGDEALNPVFDVIDVSSYIGSLNEGENLLAIGNWNRESGSSDLVAGVKLYLDSQAQAITLISPEDGVTLPVSPPATFAWEADPGYRFKIEFSPTSSFPHAFPTLSFPKRGWMPDTSTDTIPVWSNIWDKVKKMEQHEGMVYWRVIGKAGPHEPIETSEIRSFTIE